MMNTKLITRLQSLQNILIGLLDDIVDQEYRIQYHQDLSPIGWHLGHSAYIENLWLRERVLQEDIISADMHYLYMPPDCPKPDRGDMLPPREELLESVVQQQKDNITLLTNAADKTLKIAQSELMQDDYLLKFLVQHHAQHIETMRIIKTQRMMKKKPTLQGPGLCEQAAQNFTWFEVESTSHAMIGESNTWCFDNESPPHRPDLENFAISTRPVNNAQYLSFIINGGYYNPDLWCSQGQQWLAQFGVRAPQGWRQAENGGWYQIRHNGDYILRAKDPVCGISHYEASAFARYCGARLPHEYEWEIALRQQRLEQTYRVWEWCSNTFHPYPGFCAFPYREYSNSGFDGKHYVLRGSSEFGEKECRRASFRNFYTADKRHIFAGLRLAI